MKPIKFREQTGLLTGKGCEILPIYSDGKICLSCWKMSFKERTRAVLFGRVWVWVRSGATQPPIALECYKSAFEKEASDE